MNDSLEEVDKLRALSAAMAREWREWWAAYYDTLASQMAEQLMAKGK